MIQRYDDRETEAISRLIDAGEPELAAKTFRSRFRYRVLTTAIASTPFVWLAVWRILH
jgi:hypothetical protein